VGIYTQTKKLKIMALYELAKRLGAKKCSGVIPIIGRYISRCMSTSKDEVITFSPIGI
jgi:hypothetical protein